MKKVIAGLFIITILLVGVLFKGSTEGHSGDWQWSSENIEVMERSWCDYNKGRDFAKKNCAKYWE